MAEPPAPDEQVLAGGVLNAGQVVRIGDTVRRPRTDGAELCEAVLVHLERVRARRSRAVTPSARRGWQDVGR